MKWQIKWLGLSLRLLATLRYTLCVLIPGKLWYLASLWAQRCQLNQLVLFWHSLTQMPTWQRNFANKSICRRKLYILYCIISCCKGFCERRSDISIFLTQYIVHQRSRALETTFVWYIHSLQSFSQLLALTKSVALTAENVEV